MRHAWMLLVLVSGLAHADHRAVCTGPKRCFAHVQTDEHGQIRAFATPAGFGPADLQDAYNIDASVDPGATIAVVGAYGYPNLESDLASYRSQFGLPPCTVASGCLTILNQNGGTIPPGPAPMGDDWTQETALDVDMVSAGCPKCKIMVVQANDDTSDGLIIANDVAAQHGATVVSNSWGQFEGGVGALEQHFDHPGVAFFASTGDNGFITQGASYPASSSHVIAVGGTSLTQTASTARGWREEAWAGGGSACSSAVAKPAWQVSTVCPRRMTSDVSAVGDPQTGVAVFNAAAGGFTIVGGTSASSPLVAAMFALTNNGNATPQYPYTNASEFADVVTGMNGACTNILCTSAIGWDGPTGVGTPNARMLAGAKAPNLMVTPADKTNVTPGFAIDVTCTSADSATITRVDVTIDQEHFAPLLAAPYHFTAPSTFENGKHAITIECTTSTRAQSTTTFVVT
jgi:hypothetical protein